MQSLAVLIAVVLGASAAQAVVLSPGDAARRRFQPSSSPSDLPDPRSSYISRPASRLATLAVVLDVLLDKLVEAIRPSLWKNPPGAAAPGHPAVAWL